MYAHTLRSSTWKPRLLACTSATTCATTIGYTNDEEVLDERVGAVLPQVHIQTIEG